MRKILKEVYEFDKYVPQEIKQFANLNQSTLKISSDDPRYSILEDLENQISEQDLSEEFNNWCHSKGFNIEYEVQEDVFTITNVGTGPSDESAMTESINRWNVGMHETVVLPSTLVKANKLYKCVKQLQERKEYLSENDLENIRENLKTVFRTETLFENINSKNPKILVKRIIENVDSLLKESYKSKFEKSAVQVLYKVRQLNENGTLEFNSQNIVKHELSETENTIIEILEKEFKDFTLEKLQSNDSYYNLNISFELSEDIQNNLELQRFLISKALADFKQEFMTELSIKLPVVNVKVGSYQYIKGKNIVLFSATILLSNTSIKDWVSGIVKKQIKESSKNK